MKHNEHQTTLKLSEDFRENLKTFLVSLGDGSARNTVLSPNYYKFPSGVEVRGISSYLSSNGGQALQYIARSTRLDGNNKGDPVENLRKAVKFIEWEIERLENDE